MAATKNIGRIIHDGNSGIEGDEVKVGVGDGLVVDEGGDEADGLSDGVGVGEGEAVGVGLGVGEGELRENVISVSLIGSSIAVTFPL